MNKLAKTAIFLLMGLSIISYTSAAETKYVTDSLVIMLRTGPSNDRKIIGQPRTGTPLKILKQGKDYTEVETPSGKRGWVLTRYLTSVVPAKTALTQLQKDYAQVVSNCDSLKIQADQLDTTSNELSGDLLATQKALEKLTTEHETLKKESREFLKLKAKYQKIVKEASNVRNRADKLDKELQQLISSEMNTGLIYGGGLIAIGFIVGFIVKRPRRRSPFM